MAKLVVGCGFLGQRVAVRWRDAGETVYAVTRNTEHASALAERGLLPIVADVTDRSSLTRLTELTAIDGVLYAVGFDRTAGRSMREVYVAGLEAVLDALPSSVRRLIYVSSTSVYGQLTGDWIDEDSPRAPLTESGQICLAAEETLERHPVGKKACILSLAGIYGPGRLPRRETLANREPIAADPAAWLNLIHVDDAATVVIAAERAPEIVPRLLVSDGHPVIRRDYYRELAQLWGYEEPRFAETPAGGAKPSRGITNKRVSNARLLSILKLDLKYPNSSKGLAAILAADPG